MNNILIKNARIIDPKNNLDEKTDLYISDQKVAALGSAPENFTADETIDANNHWLIPGIVDLSARLREPGLEQKANIETETNAAASAGITTLCIPPDTDPVIDEPAVVELILRKAKLARKTHVYTLGALTAGLKGEHLSEMFSLKQAGCVGVSNARNAIENPLILRRAFEYASTHNITVFIEAHDKHLSENGCAHEGAIASRLGLNSIPYAAETVPIAQILELIRDTDIRIHFGRLSCARSIELISDAKANGLKVTADVAVHQLHLTDMDISSFNSLYHVIPPLRSQRDMNALRHGLAEGVINSICSDHQPHEPDAKLAPYPATEPGISGIETLLPLTLKLVENGSLTLNTAIASITCNPANTLGLNAGHLAVGQPANLCLIDPEKEWVFNIDEMLSHGRNTPFSGWHFKGKVMRTFIKGNTVFKQ
ncbi:MAG: dihydroorotase [endosymbiont of Galathealinum brachiosum]|uniref:Dihydroorotase n=1 Tax=endosymbiont of Galathealinum brachiosum TaxID=2200906 RepID=A0A370DDB4_9GAMM|nr:MAG: dihydroorotase [endosymbiont of Galathealinum brachiosum]